MCILKKLNWAILVTGWGRNAVDTLQAFNDKKLGNNNVSLVIYEEEPCGAAEIAQQMGVETLRLIKNDFSDMNSYQKKIISSIKSRNIDYVFLLNYKYLIRQEMLTAFPQRIINIHPSLFPSFLGTKTAIQDALEYGVKITGITTHIIDDKLDEGIILKQVAIKVKGDDTFDTIYPNFVKKGIIIIIETIQLIEEIHFKK